MIIALAGRRVDQEGQVPVRFPSSAESVNRVRSRIRDKLITLQAEVLVSSAACGADLLALDEAGKLGIRRRVVLPFGREEFRSTSVIDRPGNWGSLYDAILDDVQARGDLVIVSTTRDDSQYQETNHRVVEEAIFIGRAVHQRVAAMCVWEGRSRGKGDLTEEFGTYSKQQGIQVCDVPTL
jgi:hypothetical protein